MRWRAVLSLAGGAVVGGGRVSARGVVCGGVAVACWLTTGVVFAKPAQVEMVIAAETLHVCGPRLESETEAFVRRIEDTAGLARGTLTARSFADPRAAVAYAKKARPALAILPVHQYVAAKKSLGLKPFARTVELTGAEPYIWGVARRGTVNYVHIEARPGLRLAAMEIDDPRWLSNVVFETNVKAERHFQLFGHRTSADALAALERGEADVVLLYETEARRLDARLAEGGDLQKVYVSAALPPPPLVTLARPARKLSPEVLRKIQMAVPNICKGDGLEVCARLGILRMETALESEYASVVTKYDY